MAITITKLKMWKNPGYTKGCVEVPPAGSKKLPAPDWTNTTTLRPRKNGTISAIELPLSFCQVFDMSYLYMEASDGNTPANTIKVFGWIDSVEQTASSDEAVLIRWTVDWWRTYSGSITWGSGNVKRCDNSTYARPYGVPPRKWQFSKLNKLFYQASGSTPPGTTYPVNQVSDTYPYWVIVSYNNANGGVTSIDTYFWRCGYMTSDTILTYSTIPVNRIVQGILDEMLGLDPDKINGIWVSPIPPYIPDTSSIITHTFTGDGGSTTYCAYKRKADKKATSFMTFFSQTFDTTDVKKSVIIDPTGMIVYCLPWGYSFSAVYGYVDVGTVSATIHLYLKYTDPSNTMVNHFVDVASEGLVCDIPLIPLPFNSNAYSSYVLSGQRDFDLQSKKIGREQALYNGLAGSGQSAMGGAIAGGMAGKGGIGAIGGEIIGIAGAGIGYVSSEFFDGLMQEQTDKLYTRQASNILGSSGGEGWLSEFGHLNWYAVELTADSTFQTEYTSHISVNGYSVDVPTSSVSTFISAGGNLQITETVVTGNVPPQAKDHIRQRLSAGVRIKENNPSGVVP